tara:strand:- start:49 stop:306 length:258 start_codon:yes stop_codon:yes gene_type:complete
MSSSNKNVTALYCLAVMLTIWCTWNSAKNGSLVKDVFNYRVEVYQFERQVASLIDRVEGLEKQEILNDIKELDVLENPVGETTGN